MAAEGRVDFSKARLLDRKWNLRLLWLCKAYQAEKNVELLKLEYARFVSALSTDSSDVFKQAWGSSDKVKDLIKEELVPWLVDKDTPNRKDYNEYRDLLEAYRVMIGDPDDPEFMAQVEKDVEKLRQQRLGNNSG